MAKVGKWVGLKNTDPELPGSASGWELVALLLMRLLEPVVEGNEAFTTQGLGLLRLLEGSNKSNDLSLGHSASIRGWDLSIKATAELS